MFRHAISQYAANRGLTQRILRKGVVNRNMFEFMHFADYDHFS